MEAIKRGSWVLKVVVLSAFVFFILFSSCEFQDEELYDIQGTWHGEEEIQV